MPVVAEHGIVGDARGVQLLNVGAHEIDRLGKLTGREHPGALALEPSGKRRGNRRDGESLGSEEPPRVVHHAHVDHQLREAPYREARNTRLASLRPLELIGGSARPQRDIGGRYLMPSNRPILR